MFEHACFRISDYAYAERIAAGIGLLCCSEFSENKLKDVGIDCNTL